MSIEKSCGAVIYRKSGIDVEFLAVKSKANGHWGFPKGHMEERESEQETARREVSEETGLDIALLEGFRTKIEYPLSKNISKEVIYFIGRAAEQYVSIQEEEIEDYKWLNYSDMLDILTFENSKNVLKEVQGFLNNVK